MLVTDTLTTFTLNSCYKYNVFRHVVKKKVAISRCFGMEVVRVADFLCEVVFASGKYFLENYFSDDVQKKICSRRSHVTPPTYA